jgi:hypothetical protein
MRCTKLLLCGIKSSKKLKETKSTIGDDGTVDEKGKKQTVISDEFEAVWLCVLWFVPKLLKRERNEKKQTGCKCGRQNLFR